MDRTSLLAVTDPTVSLCRPVIRKVYKGRGQFLPMTNLANLGTTHGSLAIHHKTAQTLQSFIQSPDTTGL